MGSVDIGQIIDLERYPVDRPGDPRYESLIAEGRRALDESALFSFEQFLRPKSWHQL